MGTLLREELRDELNKNLGDRDDGVVEPGLTRLNRALDHAQLRIARGYDFREMRIYDTKTMTVTGTLATDAEYDWVPTTLKDIYGLVYQETITDVAYKIPQVLPRQWEQLLGSNLANSITNRPTHYVLSGGSGIRLRWFPIPNVNNWILTRRYSVWPSALVEGSASEFANKDDLIIAWATHNMFQGLGQREDATTWFAIAKDMMTQAKTEDMSQPDMTTIHRGIGADSLGMGAEFWGDPSDPDQYFFRGY